MGQEKKPNLFALLLHLELEEAADADRIRDAVVVGPRRRPAPLADAHRFGAAEGVHQRVRRVQVAEERLRWEGRRRRWRCRLSAGHNTFKDFVFQPSLNVGTRKIDYKQN